MRNKLLHLRLFVFLLIHFSALAGNDDLLARRISITVKGQTVQSVLDLIAKEGSLAFSYDAGIFEGIGKITYSASGKPVSEILNDLFGGRYSISLNRNYVILRRMTEKPAPAGGRQAAAPVKPVKAKAIIPLQQPPAKTSIIARPDTASAKDSSIRSPKKSDFTAIRRLEKTAATAVMTGDSSASVIKQILSIRPVRKDSLPVAEGSGSTKDSLTVSRNSPENSATSEPERIGFAQLSLIPGWGTNGKQGGTYSNALSVNLLAGYSRECRGFEMGLVNLVRENWGFQLGALVNVARRDNRGAQVATLLNYCGTLNGFQLGLVNIAKTSGNGTPVGFFSYAGKDGYYRGEVSADEVFWFNAVFRSGLPRFYNIFRTGIGDASMMNFSWGFGTLFDLGKKLAVCVDFTSGLVMSGSENLKYHGLLFRLSPTLDFSIAHHFTLFLGPAGNLYWYNTGQAVKPDGIAPYTIYNEVFSTGPHAIQFWIGGVFGIRI